MTPPPTANVTAPRSLNDGSTSPNGPSHKNADVPFEHFFAHADRRGQVHAAIKQRGHKANLEPERESRKPADAEKNPVNRQDPAIQVDALVPVTAPEPPPNPELKAAPDGLEEGEGAPNFACVTPGESPTASARVASFPPASGTNSGEILDQLRPSPAESANTGIDSAQYAGQMKKTAKTGQNEQVLPGEMTSPQSLETKGAEDATPLVQSWSREVAFDRATVPINLAGTYGNGPEVAVETLPDTGIQPAPSLETRVAAMEAGIERTITQFRHQGLDSLVVVLKPDSQTEMRLSIAKDGEDILIAARLERGDHQIFSERWAGLQSDLQQRGVVLSRIEPAAPTVAASFDQDAARDAHPRQQNQLLSDNEQNDPAASWQFAERLQRRRNSAMSLTPVPVAVGVHGHPRFDSWA